jgi:predicted RNA binding protein YcfA (HicA-like mRNA interferase family)
MKSYSSREVIQILESNGWYLKNVRGDHYMFEHTATKKKVPITHPRKDIPIGTIKAISRQTGIIFN